MKYTYFDTETCGLHGPIVLLQSAVDDGPIRFDHLWLMTIREAIEALDRLIFSECVVAFNLAFDWFHVCQMRTTLSLLTEWLDDKLIDHIEDYAIAEEKARFVDLCCKPKHCLDLFLHARKTKYQSTMERKPIKIRKVPVQLAEPLAKELSDRIPLSDVYFANKSDSSKRWQVRERTVGGEKDKDFRDVVLEFAPSSGLKALAFDALKADKERILKFKDLGLSRSDYPEECGYAPYALAIGLPGFWNGAWPDKIHRHVRHWSSGTMAQQYAADDITYLRQLHSFFDFPEVDDNDSVLAALVGAVRWRGFSLDIPALRTLKEKAEAEIKIISGNDLDFNRPIVCRRYLYEALSEIEQKTLKGSTKKAVLEQLSKWTIDEVCPTCLGMMEVNGEPCGKCTGGLIKGSQSHPVAERAKQIIKFREAQKEIELYDKLLKARRFHASFKVIGTLSSRMAGADGLNPQGIKKSKAVRRVFPLADFNEDFVLCGGDFDSFEVNILDAVFADPLLHEELLSGKKIHASWGEAFFGKTYDEIMATSELSGMANLYSRAKSGVFALMYGGEAHTLVDRLAIDPEIAQLAFKRTSAKYKVWSQKREMIKKQFCTLTQPGGIGSKVNWDDPAEYIESMFGFRRYFTLENLIAKTLYYLSNDPPKSWSDLKIKVIRRDREQYAGNAVRSALLGAAFAIQGSNMRAAANHIIQSAGATLTKQLQCDLWTIQPPGINSWRLIPMNIHDEVLAPTRTEFASQTQEIVRNFLDRFRKDVPLIGMKWSTEMRTWADK